MAQSAVLWTTRQLAKAAGVKVTVIQAFMRGDTIPPEAVARLRHAFEASGLAFVEDDSRGGTGVLLRTPAAGGDHPKPVGPATDAVAHMEAEIEADRARGEK